MTCPSNAKRDRATIERYKPEYEQSFIELNLDWITEYFKLEDGDREQLDDVRRTIIDPGGEIVFAVEGGEVLGTCAMQVHDAETIELAKMAVRNDARGRGLGDLLIRAALDWAQNHTSARRVMLVTNSSLTPAVTLYKKHGFIRTEISGESHYERGDVEMVLELDR